MTSFDDRPMGVSRVIDIRRSKFTFVISVILLVTFIQQSTCKKRSMYDPDPPRVPRRSWAVKNAFERYRIILDRIIPKAPDRFMLVKFNNNKTVELGSVMRFDDVWEMPVFINFDFDIGCYHTLIFLNIDHQNEFFPQKRQYLHWLVGNIPEVMLEKGKILASYLMPIPPPILRGSQRLVFLAYRQPKITIQFSEPFIPALPLPKTRTNWTLEEFVKKYKLIGPVAGNFYRIDWQTEVVRPKYDDGPK